MKYIVPEEKCCGCGVCAAVCPHHAVSMELSAEGFWVPKIRADVCVDCRLCEKVCSQSAAEPAPTEKLPQPLAYSFIHHDQAVLSKASSGGLGWALAQAGFARGWSAVGVRYDLAKNLACHFKADTLADFTDSMNSKYLQSFTLDAFSQLFDGKKYLIFGTPCQIDSLRRMIRLRGREQDFLLVDFFCHGVPSYHLWDRYWRHCLGGDLPTSAKWRDKSRGWHSFTMRLDSEKKTYVRTLESHDFFLNSFLGNLALNQPCYACKFRHTDSSADIRIGDFWGEKYRRNQTGVSAALAFTPAGKAMLEALTEYGELGAEALPDILAEQISGRHDPLPGRKQFLAGLTAGKPLWFLYLRYNRKMLLKNLIPRPVKRLLKKILRAKQG